MNKIPNRTFGVELELEGLSEEMAYLVLKLAKVPVKDPKNWNGSDRGKWRFHEDSSIRGDRTCEVVSPVLRGAEGLAQVRRVCAALVKAGAKVNPSCGLHVHVGADDLKPAEVVKLIERYAEHENFIDQLVPGSRRGSRAEFCGTMKHIAKSLKDPIIRIDQKIEEAKSDLEYTQSIQGQCWNHRHNDRARSCYYCQSRITEAKSELRSLKVRKEQLVDGSECGYDSLDELASEYDGDRYLNINLQAWHDHKTLEFRQHNGCIDGRKVANWIRFVLNFVEQSRALTPRKKARKAAQKVEKVKLTGYRLKYHNVAEAIRAAGAEGLTGRQVASVGWWSLSYVQRVMRKVGSETGLDWTTGYVNGTIRYFDAQARRASLRDREPQVQNKAPAYRSKDNGPLMGLPGYLKTYFTDRAAIPSNRFAAYV